MLTVITLSAILRLILLPEITHQDLPAAYTGLGKSHGLINQLCTHLSFTQRLVTHKVLQLTHILM